MRKQNLRKVKWDGEAMRAYVLRDGVRYYAQQESMASPGDAGTEAQVLNPDGKLATVRIRGWRETWRSYATSPGEGG